MPRTRRVAKGCVWAQLRMQLISKQFVILGGGGELQPQKLTSRVRFGAVQRVCVCLVLLTPLGKKLCTDFVSFAF